MDDKTLLILAGVAVAAGAGWYFYRRRQDAERQEATARQSAAQAALRSKPKKSKWGALARLGGRALQIAAKNSNPYAAVANQALTAVKAV